MKSLYITAGFLSGAMLVILYGFKPHWEWYEAVCAGMVCYSFALACANCIIR